MAEPALHAASALPVSRSGHWPHQLSNQPTLRVGDVLGALAHDFPSLTTSKVRFLDSQGLVTPQRTPAGYRLYSASDVERLRYVLRQQRDAYAPLSVIRERLEQLDEGLAHEALSLAAVELERADIVGIDEAARIAGTSIDMIALLETEGIVAAAGPGRFARADVALLGACVRYLEAGADVRELRALARVADREAESASALAAPLKRQDDRSEESAARGARLEAAARVFAALLHRAEADVP